MYYLSKVIDKLVSPDDETRRAERHHERQRTVRKAQHDQV